MDKSVVFAVAGSGKTTSIVERLNLEKRFLIVTYTDNNLANLKRKIIGKFGFFPATITLITYFTFLHSFCFKPFLVMKMGTKGINYDQPPAWTQKLKRTNSNYYINGHQRLYHNRIAKLLEVTETISEIKKRIEKYFDALFIDEVQDFGGQDFNFLTALCDSNVDLFFVGDFYQHTYVTSQDGNTNINLHKDYDKYKKRFIDAGLTVDTTSLAKSYRCSQSVCDFIRQHIGIEIYSHHSLVTDAKFMKDQADADRLHACNATVKLFYEEHHKFGCLSNNWGNSKGADHYQDVCIVLNGTAEKALSKGKMSEANPQTRNKLYVACSRARGNLFLLPGLTFKKYKAHGNPPIINCR